MWPFSRVKYYLAPDDFDRDSIWRGVEAPPVDLIRMILEGMPVQKMRLEDRRRHRVYRSLRHAVGWVHGYATVECADLRDTWNSDATFFEVVLLPFPAETRLYFRLMTRGREGSTMYSIAWRRVGEDLFICRE